MIHAPDLHGVILPKHFASRPAVGAISVAVEVSMLRRTTAPPASAPFQISTTPSPNGIFSTGARGFDGMRARMQQEPVSRNAAGESWQKLRFRP